MGRFGSLVGRRCAPAATHLEVGDDDHQKGTKFVPSVRLLGWMVVMGMQLLRCRWATGGWSCRYNVAHKFCLENGE